ncbi:small rab-related GTPase [Chloropicon primus]|uniref:Small rab-related GTPase n=1 Tax=Chloropicon primus TaxID=1764295 RepID=A0A5B8MUE9_9CHLO|nr:small rab-related GTPase [Chloropicon primus]|eukprot:QDZ23951.1 small rab-related GTPase [Chloropicon primus]
MFDQRSRRLSLPTYTKGNGNGPGGGFRKVAEDTVTKVRTKSMDEIGNQLSQQLKMQQLSVKPRKKDVTKVKLISMGDTGVGKSCIIKRFCEGRFSNKYFGTIGVDYGVKSVRFGAAEVRINLFDLAGGPEFLSVRNEFYKDTQGGILVFDVTNRKSFEALNAWVDESCTFGAKSPEIFVVANKIEMPSRVVSEEEARMWADENGFEYFEVSASTGSRVMDVFEKLTSRILREKFGMNTY